MQRSVMLEIGMADSEFISSERSLAQFKVQLRTWNSSLMEIDFDEPISFYDENPYDFSDLLERDEQTDFLGQALSNYYENIPASHLFKEYSFLNLAGEKSLRVVAKGINVTKKESSSR